jgi:hypothetical protein
MMLANAPMGWETAIASWATMEVELAFVPVQKTVQIGTVAETMVRFYLLIFFGF